MSRINFPERQDFGLHDHRVSPRHIAKIRHRNHANSIDWHPYNLRLKQIGSFISGKTIKKEPVVEPDWVPAKREFAPPPQERVRDERLAILQSLGEQMLAGANA